MLIEKPGFLDIRRQIKRPPKAPQILSNGIHCQYIADIDHTTAILHLRQDIAEYRIARKLLVEIRKVGEYYEMAFGPTYGDVEKHRPCIIDVVGIKEYTCTLLSVAVGDVHDHHVLFIALVTMHGTGLDHIAQLRPFENALEYFRLCGIWGTDTNSRYIL